MSERVVVMIQTRPGTSGTWVISEQDLLNGVHFGDLGGYQVILQIRHLEEGQTFDPADKQQLIEEQLGPPWRA